MSFVLRISLISSRYIGFSSVLRSITVISIYIVALRSLALRRAAPVAVHASFVCARSHATRLES